MSTPLSVPTPAVRVSSVSALRPVLGLGFALGLAALAGCSSDPAPPAVAAAPVEEPALPASWTLNPSVYRGQNGTRMVFECAPNPARTGAGSAWGTDTYSDDSALCVAAVHAGAITYEQGGRVAMTPTPGQGSYAASTRNGVESRAWGSWSGSFTVAPVAGGTAAPPKAPASAPPVAYTAGQDVHINWAGTWYAGRVLEVGSGVNTGQYKIHYEGWADSWDTWVAPDLLRLPSAGVATGARPS